MIFSQPSSASVTTMLQDEQRKFCEACPWTRRSPCGRCLVGGAVVWHWQLPCLSKSTFCYWMNRRTTWTFAQSRQTEEFLQHHVKTTVVVVSRTAFSTLSRRISFLWKELRCCTCGVTTATLFKLERWSDRSRSGCTACKKSSSSLSFVLGAQARASAEHAPLVTARFALCDSC